MKFGVLHLGSSWARGQLYPGDDGCSTPNISLGAVLGYLRRLVGREPSCCSLHSISLPYPAGKETSGVSHVACWDAAYFLPPPGIGWRATIVCGGGWGG